MAERDYHCNSFIKRELYDEPKYARIINSRSDKFKAVTAPYCKMIESQVYNEHFIKHKLPSEVVGRLKEILDSYREVRETDYSSFESSFTPEIVEACENQLFRHMLSNNPEISHIFTHCYEFYDDGVKHYNRNWLHFGGCSAGVIGTRMSGEMWTSLGNGFTNMMLMEFLAYKASAVIDYMVEGDDGFVGSNVPLPWHLVGDLGFKLKIEPVHSINECSFCGIAVMGDVVIGTLTRSLNGYGWTQDPRCIVDWSNSRISGWWLSMLRAKAMSFNVLHNSTPILYKIISRDLALTAGCQVLRKHIDNWWWWENFGVSDKIPVEPSADLRQITYEMNPNLTPSNQVQIEQEVDDNTFTHIEL